MKNNDIHSKKNNILTAVRSGRLAHAFRLLRAFSEQQMTWEITNEISTLEESYRYMLDYAMRGVADPARHKVYDSIVASMMQLADKLERHALTNESPTLYYNTLRYINQSVKYSVSAMLRDYEKLSTEYRSTDMYLSPDSVAAIDNRRRRENLERDIFNMLWTAMPLSAEDYESLAAVYKSERYYSYFKQFITSAILMGMLEYYDTRRLLLLLDAYESGDDTLSAVAIIALMIALYMYRDRTVDTRVTARLKLLSDTSRWHTDLRDAFLELVRARDTERITRTMQEEVVPEMIRLKPEITKRLDSLDPPNVDLNDLDINPEWQEMLEKSGIADKMKKLFEIQLEGGDVFMSTFAHLKSFPFFNDMANWFMPFHTERSEVAIVSEELSDMVRVIENLPIFCNNDKYSFILSLRNIPQSQRDMMKMQLNSQADGLMEMQNASLNNGSGKRASVMNRYVQDLYRFFKLFRRKGEFRDPFVLDLNLVEVPAINKDLNDIESLKATAEFYFKHKYYADALSLFKAIESISCPDIQLFEKMGYCYERMNDYGEALKYYEQAELLSADSIWTLRHIALCHRMLGDPSRALGYYRRIVDKEQEESLSTSMAMGNCYLEMGEFEKAAQYYYKVNYLDGKNSKANRQLAWCLMMQRKFDKARRLYDEIISANPTADDYLNMGHLSLAMADNNNALNYYKLCIAQGNSTLDDFAGRLAADAGAFSNMGLDPQIIPLIIDAISFSER